LCAGHMSVVWDTVRCLLSTGHCMSSIGPRISGISHSLSGTCPG
jgi:hypothetical protein